MAESESHDEKHSQVLPVPESFWADADPDHPRLSKLSHLFTTQSIGNRLFIDAILADRPITPNFREGLKVQKVIEAALALHQQGKWVSLS